MFTYSHFENRVLLKPVLGLGWVGAGAGARSVLHFKPSLVCMPRIKRIPLFRTIFERTLILDY